MAVLPGQERRCVDPLPIYRSANLLIVVTPCEAVSVQPEGGGTLYGPGQGGRGTPALPEEWGWGEVPHTTPVFSMPQLSGMYMKGILSTLFITDFAPLENSSNAGNYY